MNKNLRIWWKKTVVSTFECTHTSNAPVQNGQDECPLHGPQQGAQQSTALRVVLLHRLEDLIDGLRRVAKVRGADDDVTRAQHTLHHGHVQLHNLPQHERLARLLLLPRLRPQHQLASLQIPLHLRVEVRLTQSREMAQTADHEFGEGTNEPAHGRAGDALGTVVAFREPPRLHLRGGYCGPGRSSGQIVVVHVEGGRHLKNKHIHQSINQSKEHTLIYQRIPRKSINQSINQSEEHTLIYQRIAVDQSINQSKEHTLIYRRIQVDQSINQRRTQTLNSNCIRTSASSSRSDRFTSATAPDGFLKWWL